MPAKGDRYGIAKEEAHRQVEEWLSGMKEEDEVRDRAPERKAG